MNAKPNILLIMSDEHDPQVTGCYGDPLVRTPNMDRLAANGVTFDAAYTTSPLCVPARLSFTAGKYVSRCGAWSNSCWLPSDDYPSLPRILRNAGHTPYLCGKQHYDSTRRYGFEDLTGWCNNHSKHGKGGRRRADDLSPNRVSWESRSAEFYPGDESGIMGHDRRVTETATAFLQNRNTDEGPFFLFAGYLAPHFPLIAPQEIYDHYKGRVPMPEIPEGALDRLPTNYKQQRTGFGTIDTDPNTVQLGRDLYWALTDWFDREVGKVLDALADSEVADNTVVIYTSDHGENKGDHGMWWKNCVYEHAARIPLIVSWPARWAGGQRRTGACSLVDLVQTIAEVGGAETPGDWDGDSMLPWLDDGATAWKDMAVSEYYGHNIASGFTMLRQGPWKYVYHARMDEEHGPERELYNLEADPKEFTNLVDQPEHAERITAMHRALVDEIGCEPDEAESRCRADYAKGYNRE